MAKYVCMGASLQCSFGMSPATLMVVDPMRPMVENKLQANIMDNKPMANVMPFGMCRSLANPTVASATSAAMGTLTPMPCIPVLTAPWAPPGMEMVSNQPALLDNAQLFCAYGGQITIKNPGQQSTSE